MRIAHIVTLVTPEGAYGGPVRVAANLARAQRELGHDVVILGGFSGYDESPKEVEGVPAILFRAWRFLPRTGFAGLVAPGLQRHVRAHAAEYDAVHIHLARDLVTLPAAWAIRRKSTRYVTQTHGMIDGSRRVLAHLLDAALTRRVLGSASALLYLTDRERKDLVEVVGTTDLPFRRLRNGVPSTRLRARVAEGDEVLFLARLAPRKRPSIFVEAAIALAPKFPGVRFTLVGPDEGEGSQVRQRIISSGFADRIRWEGPLGPGRTLERLSQASVYVLPSVDEPFPMSVLEAMSVGLPTIVTDTCGLASAVASPDALCVLSPDIEAIAAGVERLLLDPSTRARVGAAALREVNERFSIAATARSALLVYEGGLGT